MTTPFQLVNKESPHSIWPNPCISTEPAMNYFLDPHRNGLKYEFSAVFPTLVGSITSNFIHI